MQLVDREREEDKERGIERERHRLSLNFSLSLSIYLHLKCSKLLAIGKTNQLNKARPGRGAASDPPENNLCMALAFVLPALWNINATRDTQLTHSHTQPWAKTGAETNCCQQELQAETEVEVEVEESRAAIVACILYGKAEIMRLSLRLLSPTAWQADEKQSKYFSKKLHNLQLQWKVCHVRNASIFKLL